MKSRLLRAYSFAVSDYDRAVQVLAARSGVMTKQEYEEIRAFVENARELMEQSRAAIERHTAEHRC